MLLFDYFELINLFRQWHQNTDTKWSSLIVLHLHDSINNSYSCYADTAYHAIMLKGTYIIICQKMFSKMCVY